MDDQSQFDHFRVTSSPPDKQLDQHQKEEDLQLMMFYQTELSNLFPNANTFPDFFNENLISPERIIKVIQNNAHSNIQVFYYHLLLLGYQMIDHDGTKTKIIERFKSFVFSEEFDILFTRQTEQYREIFNSYQFKKLFEQFLMVVQTTVEGIDQAINRFPIIDTIFIHIIRSLLFYLGVNEQFETKLENQTVLITLAQHFDLRLTCYSWENGVCWKFEDSDIFCLDDESGKLYIAYMGQPEESNGNSQIILNKQHPSIQQKSQSSESNQPSRIQTPSKVQITPKQTAAETTSKHDTQFNKFSASNESVNLGSETILNIITNNFDTCRVSEYRTENPLSYDSQNIVQPTTDTKLDLNSNVLFSFSRLPIPEPDQLIKSIEISTSKIIQSRNKFPHITQIVQSNPEELIKCNFFKNKNIDRNLNSSIEFKQWKPEKPIITTSILERSIGDYYKDFTSSFTLNSIVQPYRSEVRNIKTRVKGLKKY